MPNFKQWPSSVEWTGPTINLDWHPELKVAGKALIRLSQGTAGAVIMAGRPGVGKTLLSRIFLHSIGGEYKTIEYTDNGPISVQNAIFKAEPTLLDEIKDSYKYEGATTSLIMKCANARVLILDDLGAGYVKDGSEEWYSALMWRLLDKRKDKRTLITTNLSPAEFSQRVGERSWSRLKEILGLNGPGSTNVIDLFAVPDYRGINW